MMKSNHLLRLCRLSALVAGVLALVACSSDGGGSSSPADVEQPTYTMTIEATKGNDNSGWDMQSTRAITIDGTTLVTSWATTDQVYVKKGTTWAFGSLQPQTAGITALLEGILKGITIAPGDELTLQFPKSGAADYSGQVGTLADIAENFDYATATVQVASVSSEGNIVPVEATTTFTNLQAIVRFTLKDKVSGDALLASSLAFSDGTNSFTVTPTAATDQLYVAIPGFAGRTVSLTATIGSRTYTYKKSNVSFANGEFYTINLLVGREALDLNSVSINDWMPDDYSFDGEAN